MPWNPSSTSSSSPPRADRTSASGGPGHLHVPWRQRHDLRNPLFPYLINGGRSGFAFRQIPHNNKRNFFTVEDEPPRRVTCRQHDALRNFEKIDQAWFSFSPGVASAPLTNKDLLTNTTHKMTLFAGVAALAQHKTTTVPSDPKLPGSSSMSVEESFMGTLFNEGGRA